MSSIWGLSLKEANQAEKYAEQESAIGGRDFLKKIGSNFRLSGQKLFLDFKNPFKILAEAERQSRLAGPKIRILKIGGGGRIRTSDALRHTRFPSERTKPLCDASIIY
ncbi:MAG: hypothetical protein UU96_C0004G0002 [Parcubacteria group bacterium GW2011_GWC2_42_13]|nr:MAG: hypothetical protein UU96_C0004G0002 [Parcubacteria group bacterium GW2011_GWC2_42_13]